MTQRRSALFVFIVPGDLFDLALALLHALDVSLPIGSRKGGGTLLPERLGVTFHLRPCM